MFTSLNPPIADWRRLRIWVVGASSGIGASLTQALVRAGARLAVSARREQALIDVMTPAIGSPGAAALSVAAIEAGGHLVLPTDVTDEASVRAAHARVMTAWGGIDLTIWVAGTYIEMRADDFDLARARKVVDANINGVLNGLAVVVPMLLTQGRGGVAIVSSVAGYSGLPKALIYGPTKAALINLAESLYLDLHPRGIGVTLICPGFVATPLTAGNDFHMPALISAEEAAARIMDGLARGRFEIHFPRRFTGWLKALRILPYRQYFAMVGKATGTASSLPHPRDANT